MFFMRNGSIGSFWGGYSKEVFLRVFCHYLGGIVICGKCRDLGVFWRCFGVFWMYLM